MEEKRIVRSGYCPICGDPLVYTLEPRFEGDCIMYFDWICKNCKNEGTESWFMEFGEHIVYQEDDYVKEYMVGAVIE